MQVPASSSLRQSPASLLQSQSHVSLALRILIPHHLNLHLLW